MSHSVFGSVSSRSHYGAGDRPGDRQRYYPGTFIDDGRASKAYRTYAGQEYRKEGFDYVTTKEPFQPASDFYQKEYKRPYVYRDNRLYHTKDPVRKYYDGSGNVTVTVLDANDPQAKDLTRYAGSVGGTQRGEVQSIRSTFPQVEEPKHAKRDEVEVGYLVEHLASFDIGDDHDPSQAGQNIEAAIETLRNMDQDNAILPLRCYLTYKEQEIQVLSDKELSVLEWIKYDDVNLVSAEVHQLARYEEILLVQVKEVIHLFCPLGDLCADDLARTIKERISLRRDPCEDRGSNWQEDSSNDRYVLKDQTLKAESDVDFYDKYTMQLYGRATRDYVARNDKELTVMSGERVEIQSTRGQWWLARTSNGKAGYVPSECLESYVPSPAGLPRTAIPAAERTRVIHEDASERASVAYSAASSRPRVDRGGRDYDRRDYGRREDHRDYDRRDYDRRDDHRNYDRYQQAPPSRDNYDDSFESRARRLGTQRGFPAGTSFPTGTGLGTGTGFAPGTGLGAGFGTTGFGTAGLGTTGFGTTGLGTAGLGTTGFGTIGPSAGFSTVSSATGAGLFPSGFTAQMQGSLRGSPLVGTPTLGTTNLGVQGLGGVALGAPMVPQLGRPQVVGVRPMGTVTRTVPAGANLGLGGGLHGNTLAMGGNTFGLGGNTMGLGGNTLGLGGNTLGLGGNTLGLGGNTLGLGGNTLGLGGGNAGYRIG